jgi:hypothetical protein
MAFEELRHKCSQFGGQEFCLFEEHIVDLFDQSAKNQLTTLATVR